MQYNLNMKLYKRENGYYYISVNGNRASLGTQNKAEAKKLFERFKQDYFQKKVKKITHGIDLSEFAQEYERYAANFLALRTQEIASLSFKRFIEIVGDKPIKAICKQDVEYYMQERLKIVQPTTVNIEYRALKSAFTTAKDNGHINKNPFQQTKAIRIQEKPPRFFTSKELRLIEDAITDKEYKMIYYFLLYTGARRSEVAKLTWQDVKQDYIILRETKSKKVRYIPIHPELSKHIQHKGVGRLFRKSPNNISKYFSNLFKKIGIQDASVHTFRHTFASFMAMSGESLASIQQLLGHSNIKTTMIYAHLTTEHLRNAVNNLNFNTEGS